MTPDELAAIKALVDAATEGPWRTGDQWNSAGTVGVLSAKSTHGNEDIVASCCDHGADPADAQFIAHARQDVPRLLAEVERLTAVVDAVRELHAEGEFGCPYPSHGCNDFYYRGNYCPDAGTSCEACGEKYPCPTIRALGGDS